MAGLKIVIPGLVTDTTLPKRYDDPVLTSGSLLLVTPVHDMTPWAAGVPANGSKVKNLAADLVRAQIPSGDLDADVTVLGDLTGTLIRYERTTKGGLHGIISQGGTVTAGNGLMISIPTAIMNYLLANPTHNFYFSQWRRLTRAALTTSPDNAKTFMQVVPNTVSTVNPDMAKAWAFLSHLDATYNPAGAASLGRTIANSNVLGNNFAAVAGKTLDTVLDASLYTAPQSRALATIGATPWQNHSSVIRNALQSWIFYRTYVEDLTVSGRTFAQVEAIDKALYEKQMNTSGGKYYGDTYTAPSVLP